MNRLPRAAEDHLAVGAVSLTPVTGQRDRNVELVQRSAEAKANKRVGSVLKGKWKVERLLGAGGMAHVFAARHRNGRRVAIKCMRPELTSEPELVERFLREGYVANKIEHPGAVAILDDELTDDGTPFLVMELLVGQTLRQRLESGPLPLGEALRVTGEVLDVLAAAHDKGIVHRDLKPDNLFVTEDGAVKVLDFGIARLKERARNDYETSLGTTMGTVGYMPPEQARGLIAEIDARTDIWAIGATLYALLTGHPVHEAETTNEALLLAMTTPVRPMRTLLPALPPSIHSLLDGALAFDKGRRHPSARAMRAALDAAATEQSSGPLAPPRRPPSLADHEHAPVPLGARASETLLARAWARRGLSQPSDETPSDPRKRVAIGIAFATILAAMVGAFIGRSPRPPRDAAPSSALVTSGIVTAPSAGELPPPRPSTATSTTTATATSTAASSSRRLTVAAAITTAPSAASTPAAPSPPPHALAPQPGRATRATPSAPVPSAAVRPAGSTARDPLGLWR